MDSIPQAACIHPPTAEALPPEAMSSSRAAGSTVFSMNGNPFRFDWGRAGPDLFNLIGYHILADLRSVFLFWVGKWEIMDKAFPEKSLACTKIFRT